MIAGENALKRQVLRWSDEVRLTYQGKVARDGNEGKGFLLTAWERDGAPRIIGCRITGDAALLLESIKEGQVTLAQRRQVNAQPHPAAVRLNHVSEQTLLYAPPHHF